MAPILDRPRTARPSTTSRVAASGPPDPPRWPQLITELARAATAIAVLVAVLIDRF